MCPDCGKVQVETNISGIEGPNFGKHLYKCPIELFSAIGLFSKANSDHRAKRNVFFLYRAPANVAGSSGRNLTPASSGGIK